MIYGSCVTCENSCKQKPVLTPEDNCKKYKLKNKNSFNGVYTFCPNCGALADRWDIKNNCCSSCRLDDNIFNVDSYLD